ncbi:MAG: glycoside hydrolase family 20 zincin-like fold domain-containing protein [Armatimonadota bacterium]
MTHCYYYRALPALLLLLMVPSCSCRKTEVPGVAGETKAAKSAPLLIPRPKFVTYNTRSDAFALTADTVIVVPDKPTSDELSAAALLHREAARQFHCNLPTISAGKLGAGPQNSLIIICTGSAVPPIASAGGKISEPTTDVPKRPEGYALTVTQDQVLVQGRDGRGVLWGVQTLLQVLNATGSGSPAAPAVSIRDWPTLSLRAAHLFHGQNALPFHKKLIDRIFSHYKMNALFLQAEQLRWNHDPGVAPPWAGKPADIREEIAFAQERGVTVYPLMQSYGHMAWLLDNDRNRELAEDPATPYAINYSDPKAVAYLEGFNAEADALFDARGFHIGLDEVTMRGRFPYRSKPKDFSQLYVQAATHWHSYFRKRDKPLFMWADMALYAVEENPDFGTAPSAAAAKAVRSGLPKDIIMMDWQYGERTSFPSLIKLKEAGFKNVVAATWYRPKNIQNFARAANEAGAMGAIQTTWAGYESDESVLDTEHRKQFTAMVLAAEYFWNGGEGPSPDKLPYDYAKIFSEQWNQKP